jgi:hypothetical protein
VARRLRLEVAALTVLGALSAVACQPGGAATPSGLGTGPGVTVSPVGTTSEAQLPPTDPIEGVVVNVESNGLDSVKAFTLRAIDGQTYRFVLGRLQNAVAFPPGHLAEHAANSEPILVTFEGLGDTIIATRLDDANP